ncbi:MAG: hypothetical protein JXR71_04080 [Bacteroidales bacterium]|nr:hypothetical protein [Bacteroidales bacterium]
MKKEIEPGTFRNEIATFRRIRKTIGWLGIGLPFTLVILSLIPFFHTAIQQSISHYYYTNLREIFTGTLCAVSLFLMRYKGVNNPVFWKNDNKMTNLAGIMALGIALIPTNPYTCSDKIYTLIPYCENFIGYIHYFFAAGFFLILAIISLAIFTIGQNQDPDIKVQWLNENNIYRICGYGIILFIILIPICDHLHLFRSSTLILETLALIAFGTSWLIKGRVLGDKGRIGRVLYREQNR